MRPLLYRIVGLEVETCAVGYNWRAWIVVKGVNTPAKGHVDDIADLGKSMRESVKATYAKVVGSPLPDSAP